MTTQVASPVALAAAALAEIITQPLYDAQSIPTATAQTNFFATGQVNLLLGNVTGSGGLLPNPKFFRIGGFRLVPDITVAAGAMPAATTFCADYTSLLTDGFFTFQLGGLKPYMTCPNFFVPGGLGPVVRGFSNISPAATESAYSINNGQAEFLNFLRLKYPISLPPMQSFGATINWTALTLNATRILYLFLDGEQGREVM